MIQNDTFKWFIRGFALTALALLVVTMVVSPNIGRAQRGGDEMEPQEAVAEEGEPSTTLATDDASGRNMVPVSPDDPVDDDREGGEGDGVSATVLGTDDPAGRNMVPAPAEGEPDDEQDGMGGERGSATILGTDDPRVGQGSAGDPGGVAAAGGISAQKYGSPLVIPAADFAPRGNGEDFYFTYSGGYVRGGYGCVNAAAYLPQGATVEEVYATVYDNDGGGSVRIYVRRVDNFDGTVDDMAYMNTTNAGASPNVQVLSELTINQPDVEYPGYSYYVNTCLDSNDIRFYSVRFYYTE